MEVDLALIAQGGDFTGRGIHIFGGGVDTVGVSELPSALPPFAVVIRFARPAVSETERHELTLVGINPVGEERVLAEGVPFEFDPPPRTGRAKSYANVMISVGLKVMHEGKYQFVISADGTEMKRLDMWVEDQSQATN